MMEPTLEEIIDGVQDLVSLPDVYIKVRELLADPTSSIDEFAKIVSFEPGLTAKILRIANSAFFGFATKIDNITRAINIIGTGQLHDLVLATSAINTFSDIPESVENMELFWKRSIYCGVMAQLIASKCNSLDSERYFVIGLLHNIGHLVLCLKLPKTIHAVIERAHAEGVPIYVIERDMLGYDYAELGSRLVESWQLPEAFVEPIQCQLNPAIATDFPLEAAALHIADNISMLKYLNNATEQQIPPVLSSAWQLTGLNKNDIDILQIEGDCHFEEAQMLFIS